MPERENQLPHSPIARAERIMCPIVDRDLRKSPALSPPPAHVKDKGKGKRQAPPPPPPKKEKKPKKESSTKTYL
jgi:hypothetical protein